MRLLIWIVVAALLLIGAVTCAWRDAHPAQAEGPQGWHPGYLDNAADGYEYVAIDSKGVYTPPRGCKSGDTDNGDGTCTAAEGVVPVARHHSVIDPQGKVTDPYGGEPWDQIPLKEDLSNFFTNGCSHVVSRVWERAEKDKPWDTYYYCLD